MDKKINLLLLTISFVLFSSSTLTLAVDCPVPDTGQTKCYNNESEITCPSPGEDFYGQDVQYICNPHSYTKLDANGNDLPVEATEWGMVRDNVTELIWENKTNDSSIHDKNNTYAWQDAQDVFIATLNSQNFGGHSDWRLPTIKELSTLVDSSITYPIPAVNTTYFPNTRSFIYWSSTTDAYSPNDAWNIDFSYGDVNSYFGKSIASYVRAVRGGQCETFGNYIDNGDGTVTDTNTGLMWQQDTAPGTYTWEQALSYCESSTLAEYDDWRLPNRNELQSIVDYSSYDPSIDTAYFPNTESNLYWSSTTDAHTLNDAWNVYFSYVDLRHSSKSGSSCVRAVRSGQCGPFDTSTTTTIAGSTTSTISGSTTTTIQSCPSEQIYGEYSAQTDLLRYFRDNVLLTTPEGQELIRLYYEWSPAIIKAMEEDENFKEYVKEMIDGILPLVSGEISNLYNDELK